MFRRIALAVLVLAATLSSRVLADPPTVNPGDCVYLYGAPPGAPSAPSEDVVSGTRIYDYCGADAHVTTHGTSSTSVEVAFVDGPFVADDQCRASAWTGHRFTVGDAGAPTQVQVDVAGSLRGAFLGLLSGQDLRITLTCDVSEVDGGSAARVDLANAVLFDLEQNSQYLLLPDEPFSRRFSFLAYPGRTYEIALRLTAMKVSQAGTIDFGTPGSGRGAHYDSIQVCVEKPPEDVLRRELASLRESLRDDDLESKLYARDCQPTVWMPAAQGGRLEAARTLTADLLARAVATGDPGVNAHVATDRLGQADAYITNGQYQRACRSLCDAVRALTTP